MALKGPVPISDAVKKMRGTYQPCRSEKNNPKPQPIGPYLKKVPRVPKNLMEEAKPHWKRLSKELVEARMLAKTDLTAFKSLTEAWGFYDLFTALAIADPLDTEKKASSVVVQARLWNNTANKLGERFGLNPAARARVAPPAPEKEKEVNPWDAI